MTVIKSKTQPKTQPKTQLKTQPKTQPNTRHLPAQPGDIWVTQRKNSLGVGSKLMCTDEEWDENPSFYRFYYLIGCANIGPWTFLDTKTMEGFDLYKRKGTIYNKP